MKETVKFNVHLLSVTAECNNQQRRETSKNKQWNVKESNECFKSISISDIQLESATLEYRDQNNNDANYQLSYEKKPETNLKIWLIGISNIGKIDGLNISIFIYK